MRQFVKRRFIVRIGRIEVFKVRKHDVVTSGPEISTALAMPDHRAGLCQERLGDRLPAVWVDRFLIVLLELQVVALRFIENDIGFQERNPFQLAGLFVFPLEDLPSLFVIWSNSASVMSLRKTCPFSSVSVRWMPEGPQYIVEGIP